MKTLQEVTAGRKLRPLPPKLGEGGAYKPREFSLRNATRAYVNTWSTWRKAWNQQTKAETAAHAHAMRHKELRNALLAYTADAAFVARALISEAWAFPEACEQAEAAA